MDNNRFHPLDILVADNSISMLETLVPFVEFPFKKLLVFYIKYRELTAIINSLNNRDFLKSCGFDCHPKTTEDMICDMCKFMPGNMVGNIKQMQQVFSMMQMMNQDNQSASMASMFGESGNSGFSQENITKAFNIFNQMNGQMSDQMQGHTKEQGSENTNHFANNFMSETDDDLFNSVMNILDEEQYY